MINRQYSVVGDVHPVLKCQKTGSEESQPLRGFSSHHSSQCWVESRLPSSWHRQPPFVPIKLPAAPAPATWLQPVRGVLLLRSSYPDTRLVRSEPLARAYRRVLRRNAGSLLGTANPKGT